MFQGDEEAVCSLRSSGATGNIAQSFEREFQEQIKEDTCV